MLSVVVYGTGSSVLGDIEESAYRAKIRIAAGVKNHPGDSFLSKSVSLLAPQAVSAELTALPFIVPLFTPGYRQAAMREALSFGFAQAYTLVDPTTALPRDLKLGDGSFINSGVSLGSGSRFEEFVFINRGASVGHHARVGRFVSVGPGAVIAGQVTIGYGAMIGAGAIVLPSLAIGNNAIVGAGSVVVRDVPDECLVLGNPAKIIRRSAGGYKGTPVE